jgi:hypothetical protein
VAVVQAWQFNLSRNWRCDARKIVAVWSAKEAEFRRVKHWKATLAMLGAFSASMAVAEDFKTINGKIYKDATISRVEADGLILKTKTGISKVYFIELPKEVRERFLPSPVKTVAARRMPERTPIQSKGWVARIANRKSFVILFVTGTVIIAGVVFAIIRSRIQ